MGSKVLVIDDSKTARKEVVRVVHNHGILTHEAQNGKEALALLEEKGNISLVFCDVNMPDMNGIEFLEAVKANPKHEKLPIVMLTSEATQDVMRRAKELGVTGWIIKPADPNTVNTLLATFCS